MKQKSPNLPTQFQQWFDSRGWQLREYQQAMLDAFEQRQSTLLIAPTGAGKTLSGLLPSLVDLSANPQSGMHTLYISPLKALTHDIERNLLQPVAEMGLDITIETRTGDTPSHKRQRQRKKPPNIFLTTPESLMLMLSYADAERIFGKLKTIVVDEVHAFAAGKRGDFTALAIAQLRQLSPQLLTFGLSATVAEPDKLARWLGPTEQPVAIQQVKSHVLPNVRILDSKNRIPFGGFMAKYAVPEIYAAIQTVKTALVFVNTRAQAELLFQFLWEANDKALPIAIYHGSLSKEQRRKTESLMAAGKIRAVVSTSALELGIDWGDIQLVIQVGAPKGVSRLLQRIGRSNHRMDEPSEALLVPANRFEALECDSAIKAIAEQQLDGEPFYSGALDVIPQFIVNCLCSQASRPETIYKMVRTAPPYADLEEELFKALWQFTEDGGYALQAYERYRRLELGEDGLYRPASKRIIQRHRQNVGTIVEAGRLKVKRLRRAHQGKVIGEVEEYFAQQLVKGDTFLFAGEMLQFECIRDMFLEARPSKAGEPKIPSYVGGQMPLSTFLAEGVKRLLDNPQDWPRLPTDVQEWLSLQAQFSHIPSRDTILIEQFPHRQTQFTLFYTFDGRKAHQTLGMLLTRRMEKLKLKPLSFSITDYGLSICSVEPVTAAHIDQLFSPDILGDELENWMLESPMLKRSFRRVAMVSGLIEQQYHGQRKSMRQVTFSTDLIYDTLREYDPDHILLKVTREDAERELLDLSRLGDLLIRYVGRTQFVALEKVSPMAIPIVLDVRSEAVKGAGREALLEQASLYAEAEQMMDDVRALLAEQ
ncbi:ligase-associated DNA damage response DEXH box helicase [Alteromonas sp. ASW11-36]|uniref:Ligase-associated DNA damage response DEXH box helicase n=1 Tax=Alteromonas arenosi TaxID=3055817 RepID=A0ABT7SS50_9ALTE|nr:ligase-associated DNA damage response DEXH box helicase [Alteromonas sp. ASW11-36]MDM7859021.1 ligase-associated DNA damage response DEXH box helicase [Alteromonas sp. ASW11-36]